MIATVGVLRRRLRISCGCLGIGLSLTSGAAHSQDAGPPFPPPTDEAVAPTPPVAPQPPGSVEVGGAARDRAAPLASPAREAQAPRFGGRGQFTLLGGTSVSISSTSWTSSPSSSFTGTQSNQLDYFVVRNVSLGLDLYSFVGTLDSSAPDGSRATLQTEHLRIGGRIGVNVPFGKSFSWYPRVAFGYENIQEDDMASGQASISNATGFASTRQAGAYLDVYAPLLIHPASHFFLGFGPELFQNFGDVTAGGRDVGGLRTSLGAGLVIGGYWGGSVEEQAGTATRAGGASEPDGIPRAFGDRGELVFTNALVTSIHTTTFSLTDSGAFSASVGGSVDYFVVDRISLGVGADFSYSSSTLLDEASGNQVSSSATTGDLSLRLGMSLPIGGRLSLYPVASIGFQRQTSESDSSGTDQGSTSSAIVASLYAPLLVHPAEHFFFGFGPTMSTDLWQQTSFPRPSDAPVSSRATTVGVGLEVGGWVP